MDRIFFKSSKFTVKGEAFETPSGLGGTFSIKFVKKHKDGSFEFVRPKVNDWPRATYCFTEAQLSTQVFRLIPSKYDRSLHSNEKQETYKAVLADPHIDRVDTI